MGSQGLSEDEFGDREDGRQVGGDREGKLGKVVLNGFIKNLLLLKFYNRSWYTSICYVMYIIMLCFELNYCRAK